jgi:hypothetical protein
MEVTRHMGPDHAALTWEGAIDVEHTPEWSRPWRLPRSHLELFPTEGLRSRAAMAAGVRIVFDTDSTTIGCRAATPVDQQLSSMDLVVDGSVVATTKVDGDGWFRFAGVPAGMKTVELWLPQYGELRIAGIMIDHGGRIRRSVRPQRPRLLVYGSSITQCRDADSSTQTWPAQVAREFGADLTCLGLAGQCQLDPMVARIMRDRPADLTVACLGINVYGSGAYNSRSFLPTVLGFLSTLRDGRRAEPIVVISPIASPARENEVGGADMTLAEIRAEVHHAVQLLRDHGDTALHVVDGRSILGPEHTHLLYDGLHPNAEGYRQMARAMTAILNDLGVLNQQAAQTRS